MLRANFDRWTMLAAKQALDGRLESAVLTGALRQGVAPIAPAR